MAFSHSRGGGKSGVARHAFAVNDQRRERPAHRLYNSAARAENRAGSWIEVGFVQALQNNRKAALSFGQEGLTIFEKLVALDRTNAEWRKDLENARALFAALQK